MRRMLFLAVWRRARDTERQSIEIDCCCCHGRRCCSWRRRRWWYCSSWPPSSSGYRRHRCRRWVSRWYGDSHSVFFAAVILLLAVHKVDKDTTFNKGLLLISAVSTTGWENVSKRKKKRTHKQQTERDKQKKVEELRISAKRKRQLLEVQHTGRLGHGVRGWRTKKKKKIIIKTASPSLHRHPIALKTRAQEYGDDDP